MLSIIILSSFLIISCQAKHERNESVREIVKGSDKVDVIFYNHNDTLAYSTTDSGEVNILTELVSGDNEKIPDSCFPAGKLLYKQKGETIFEVQFSISSSNNSMNCDYVTYTLKGENYKQRLTYSAGMFIDDVYSRANNR